MKNKLLELQIQALIQERKALFNKFSETPFVSSDWQMVKTNYTTMIADIDFQINNLMLQIQDEPQNHENEN